MSGELNDFVKKLNTDLNEAITTGHGEHLLKDIQEAYTKVHLIPKDQRQHTVQGIEDQINKQNKELGLPDLNIIGFGGTDHTHGDKKEYVLLQQKDDPKHPDHKSIFKVDSDNHIHKMHKEGKQLVEDKTTEYQFDKKSGHYISKTDTSHHPTKSDASQGTHREHVTVNEGPKATSLEQPTQPNTPSEKHDPRAGEAKLAGIPTPEGGLLLQNDKGQIEQYQYKGDEHSYKIRYDPDGKVNDITEPDGDHWHYNGKAWESVHTSDGALSTELHIGEVKIDEHGLHGAGFDHKPIHVA